MKRLVKAILLGATIGALSVRSIVKLFEGDPNNRYAQERLAQSNPGADYIMGAIMGSVLGTALAIISWPFRRHK